MNKIKVIYGEPRRQPEVVEVDLNHDLEYLFGHVGISGSLLIPDTNVTAGEILYEVNCAEARGLPYNRLVNIGYYHADVYGPFLISSFFGKMKLSLNEETIKVLLNKLNSHLN